MPSRSKTYEYKSEMCPICLHNFTVSVSRRLDLPSRRIPTPRRFSYFEGSLKGRVLSVNGICVALALPGTTREERGFKCQDSFDCRF
jgi:hypothetical protein